MRNRPTLAASSLAALLILGGAAQADDRLTDRLIGKETDGVMYYWTDKCTGKEHRSRTQPTPRNEREAAYMKKCIDGWSVSASVRLKGQRKPRPN